VSEKQAQLHFEDLIEWQGAAVPGRGKAQLRCRRCLMFRPESFKIGGHGGKYGKGEIVDRAHVNPISVLRLPFQGRPVCRDCLVLGRDVAAAGVLLGG